MYASLFTELVRQTNISSLVEAAIFLTLPERYSGTCEVIRVASLISVSPSVKYSLTPAKLPPTVLKNTLLPAPTGDVLRSHSNFVD